MQAAATQLSPQQDVVGTVAAAEDVRSAIDDLCRLLLRDGAATGVEWWAPRHDGSVLVRELSAGDTSRARTAIQLGPAGSLVIGGDTVDELVTSIAGLRPFLRHRWSEEQLAEHASRLARKNEALADFAGLVAHDVRSSLVAALREEDPRAGVTRALDLVESILEAVRAEQAADGVANAADCLQQAIADLGECPAEIVATVTGDFPMPPDALRLVLRNLLANAVAADARQIHVSALAREDQRILVVDDDGVGLAAPGRYAGGAQLGLTLCRRLVERCNGVLELRPRAIRGTRALIIVAGAER